MAFEVTRESVSNYTIIVIERRRRRRKRRRRRLSLPPPLPFPLVPPSTRNSPTLWFFLPTPLVFFPPPEIVTLHHSIVSKYNNLRYARGRRWISFDIKKRRCSCCCRNNTQIEIWCWCPEHGSRLLLLQCSLSSCWPPVTDRHGGSSSKHSARVSLLWYKNKQVVCSLFFLILFVRDFSFKF